MAKFTYTCMNCGKVETYQHQIIDITIIDKGVQFNVLDEYGNPIFIDGTGCEIECPYCLNLGQTILTIDSLA